MSATRPEKSAKVVGVIAIRVLDPEPREQHVGQYQLSDNGCLLRFFVRVFVAQVQREEGYAKCS
jgi:hypothetical protein